MKVRVLAWLMYRGANLLQIVGLGAVAVGAGFLLGWPVGLVVAGVELTVLGVLLEMRPNARTDPRTPGYP